MKLIPVSIVFVLTLSPALAMNFKPPTSSEKLRAIGSTDRLANILKKAFEPGGDFEPIPVPRAGDWLAEHYESGQTFDDFAKSKPNRPVKRQF